LKTVSAYLNSNGGTLLVGVGDRGDILGLHKDGFQDKDKLNLHFTNLVKHHIGEQYLPFIESKVFDVDGKRVLKVKCEKSDKHVFLRHSGMEEFYVRNGPSSTRLDGQALIDYIKHNFG
jgi:predicted HTH transcriptional regulator